MTTAQTYTDQSNLEDLPTVQEILVSALESNSFGRTQREIAMEIGYTKQQSVMLTMIKNGTNKLPVDKLFKAASALRVSPIVMLAAYLKEQFGEDEKSWKALKTMIEHMHDDEEDRIINVFKKVKSENKNRMMIVNDETLERLEKFISENMMSV